MRQLFSKKLFRRWWPVPPQRGSKISRWIQKDFSLFHRLIPERIIYYCLLVGFANKLIPRGVKAEKMTSHTLIINRSEVIKKKPLACSLALWQVKLLLLLLLSRDIEKCSRQNGKTALVSVKSFFPSLFTCRSHEASAGGILILPLDEYWEWFNWRVACTRFSMWDSCLDQSSQAA